MCEILTFGYNNFGALCFGEIKFCAPFSTDAVSTATARRGLLIGLRGRRWHWLLLLVLLVFALGKGYGGDLNGCHSSCAFG